MTGSPRLRRPDPLRRAVLPLLLAAIAGLAAGAAGASDPVLQAVGSAPAASAAPAQVAEADPAPSPAADEMLRSMREKGLLTEDEYQELYRRQAKYEAEQQQREGLPGWLRDWTFGGELLFRYERRDFGKLGFGTTLGLGSNNINVVTQPNNGLGVENRGRFRVRVGAEKKVIDGLTAGFRLSTSAPQLFGQYYSTLGTDYRTATISDPRSPHINFGDFFSYKSIFLDRAYLSYTPPVAPTLNLVAGKFANPFISPEYTADWFVWDPDLQPEGVAARYRFDVEPERVWLDARAAFFTVQEQSTVTITYNATTGTATSALPDIDQQNPYLMGFQGGVHVRPIPSVELGGRVSYYDLQHIGTRLAAAMEDLGNGGAAISHNPLFANLGPSNPLYQSGRSSGRSNELVIDAYAHLAPFGEDYTITPWFQYMTIMNADSQNTGWTVGVDLGSLDFVRLTLFYASLQRNATFALFTDSETFEGFTNANGWYVAAERRLWRGVRVRGALYRSWQLDEKCGDAAKSTALCDTASQITLLAPYRQSTLSRYRWQFDVLVDF